MAILEQFNVAVVDIYRILRSMFLQDRLLIFLLIASVAMNLAIYMALAVLIGRPAEAVVLHYNVYFGINLIDNWPRLYVLPGVGTFVWLVNTSLAVALYRGQRLLAYQLIVTTAVLEVCLAAAGAMIIFVNTQL